MIARHHTLQRLLVRMTFDPAFGEALLRNPWAELARLGLGEREARLLAGIDRRALLHDPQRCRRALHALMGELKASSAIALAETKRIAFLDGFFASQHFHRMVQDRGSLAAAYADFLLGAGLSTPQLPEVVRIEARLALSRRELAAAGGSDWRAPPRPSHLVRVARAPGVAIGRHTPDALAAIQAAERFLFDAGLVPALALVDDAPPLVLPPPTGAPPIGLGFIPTLAGISLVELEPPLFQALERVQGPTTVEAIGRQLAESLVDDEVLVAIA